MKWGGEAGGRRNGVFQEVTEFLLLILTTVGVDLHSSIDGDHSVEVSVTKQERTRARTNCNQIWKPISF